MQVRIDTSEDPRLAKILDTVSSIQLRALGRLGRGIQKAGLEIAGEARKLRFHGKGPYPVSENKLGQVTGRLGRSIRSTKAQVNLRTGEISVGFGSNVKYFAVHEFGFDGQVKVKGHQRRLIGPAKVNTRGKLTKKYQDRLKKKLTERNLAGVKPGNASGTQVRGHTRRVKVPARAPLGTQLKSISTRAAFLRGLRSALEPLLRGK